MPSRWFNLYGTKPQDRSMLYNSASAYYLEGQSFLGRVLLSMNINPSERPVLTKTSANLSREPPQEDYVLVCEPYEIANITETQGKDARIEVNFGLTTEISKIIKYKDKYKSYKFKGKDIIDPIKGTYPSDLNQVPDIICTLQAQKFFGGVWNVGYFRIKVTDLKRDDNTPRWYKFKSLDKPHSSPGKMLCNFFLTTEKEKHRKMAAKPTVKSTYKLYYHLYYSLDICPDTAKEEKITSHIKISVGGKELGETKRETGHFPLWNFQGDKVLSLPKELSFAPDLTISLWQKGWFWNESQTGEINIPLKTISKDYKRPRFYQFYNYGESKGKLLAVFSIREYDNKKAEEKNFDNILNDLSKQYTIANIRFGILGLRNLVNPTNDLEMKVKLLYLKPDPVNGTLGMVTAKPKEDAEEEKSPEKYGRNYRSRQDEEDSEESIGDDDEENNLQNQKEILERNSVTPEFIREQLNKVKEDKPPQNDEDLEKNEDKGPSKDGGKGVNEVSIKPISKAETTCPNFCETFVFEKVPFCQDPFLWPIVWIQVRDSGTIKGTENLDLIFPLIRYVDFIEDKQKLLNLKLLEKAYKTRKTILEDSIETTLEEVKEMNDSNSLDSEDDESETSSDESNAINVDDASEGEDSEGEESNDSKAEVHKTKDKAAHVLSKASDDEEEEEKIETHEHFQTYNKHIDSIRIKLLEDKAKEKAKQRMYEQDYIDLNEVITLEVHNDDKEYEQDVRERKLEKLRRKRDELTEQMNEARTKKQKDKKRAQLITNRRKIEELENEMMDEDKFWNYMGDNDNEFQYGRAVLAEETLDTLLKPPYAKLELKTQSEMLFEEMKPLDPRNISDDGKRQRFMKAKISVETEYDIHKRDALTMSNKADNKNEDDYTNNL